MTIIQVDGYPGYFYKWIEPLQQWVMTWDPNPYDYSPPVLDDSVRWIHMAIPDHIKSFRALDTIKLAQDHDMVYIYYRCDLNKIEIWSRNLEASCISLNKYLYSIKSTKKLSD